LSSSRKQLLIRVLEFYEALGIDSLPLEIPDTVVGSAEQKAEALERLRGQIVGCSKCGLCGERKTVVFGEGNPDAELMFIGEGPGREEDIQGRPFVGEAGRLLTRLINRMGFDREEVFIANVVKCRPPGNRDPREDEIEACLPYLKKQIEIIAPRVIMSLGRISTQTLLQTKTPISRLRGKFARFADVDLMPTFHPAYLLRNPKDKMLVWSDAQKVLARLGRSPEN